MQGTPSVIRQEKKTSSLNILLIAEEAAGIKTLKLLAQQKHKVVGVLTSEGTGQSGASIAGVAKSIGYPILPSKNVKDPAFASWVESKEVDVLLNVHALYIIRPEIIRAARIGAFNLHPGPLPQYAGLNAPSWAIYRNESPHAVTLHWIAPGIDTGDIAYQSRFELGPEDTGLSVSAKCVQQGLPLIERLLEDLTNDPGSIPRHAQDLSKRNYFYRDRIPWDGSLPWSQPARVLDAFVRACDYHPFLSPWGHPKTYLGQNKLAIIKVTLSQKSCSKPPGTVGYIRDGAAAVATGDEWLMVNYCKTQGKYHSGADVLQPGQRLGGRVKRRKSWDLLS